MHICVVASIVRESAARAVDARRREYCSFVSTGVAAGKLWGCEGILPEFSQLARKKIKQKWPPKKSPSWQFGRHFFQIKACWALFLLKFAGSLWRFSDFSWIFLWDFARIFTKSKLLGVLLPPPPPTPVFVRFRRLQYYSGRFYQ